MSGKPTKVVINEKFIQQKIENCLVGINKNEKYTSQQKINYLISLYKQLQNQYEFPEGKNIFHILVDMDLMQYTLPSAPGKDLNNAINLSYAFTIFTRNFITLLSFKYRKVSLKDLGLLHDQLNKKFKVSVVDTSNLLTNQEIYGLFTQLNSMLPDQISAKDANYKIPKDYCQNNQVMLDLINKIEQSNELDKQMRNKFVEEKIQQLSNNRMTSIDSIIAKITGAKKGQNKQAMYPRKIFEVKSNPLFAIDTETQDNNLYASLYASTENNSIAQKIIAEKQTQQTDGQALFNNDTKKRR